LTKIVNQLVALNICYNSMQEKSWYWSWTVLFTSRPEWRHDI